MNRLLVAILLSLAVHGVLLLCRFGWPTTASRVDVPLRIISVQLPDAPPLPPAKLTAAPPPKVTASKQHSIRPPQALTAAQPRPAAPERPVAGGAPDHGDDLTTNQLASSPEEETAPPQGNMLSEAGSIPAAAPQLAHPLYRENQPPAYPPLARKQRYQGTTELAVLVNKNGVADELRLQNSSGHPVLDQAAMAAVRQWKFAPGRQGTEPVAMWVTVPIRFELH